MSIENSKPWMEFLTNVRKAKEDLGNPEIIWYRGQWNYNHYLLPSLLRFENGIDKERYLYQKFQRFADKMFKGKKSEWDTLFDMQHYGTPTRLLDWTESFGIALFFAAHYNFSRNSNENAAIYLLNPLKINLLSGYNHIINLPSEEQSFSYKKIYWEKQPHAATAPVAIEPILNNDRIIAQRGVFTIHNDDISPIEDLYPNAIKKVLIPNDAINPAMEFLDLANMNEYTVYPDFEGLTDYLLNTTGLIYRWK